MYMAEEFNDIVKRLQDDMRKFLQNTELEINGVTIRPLEIEAYYYEEGVFEDCYVHCNEMQTEKNKGHFYVHRKGKREQDAYSGGNRCCLDYVVGKKGTYFSYLLRSASVEFNGESVLCIKLNRASCGPRGHMKPGVVLSAFNIMGILPCFDRLYS